MSRLRLVQTLEVERARVFGLDYAFNVAVRLFADEYRSRLCGSQ